MAEATLDDLIAGTASGVADSPPADPPAEPSAETDDARIAAEAATDETPLEEAEDSEADFFRDLQETYGEDLSDKYKTPQEALKGLVEAYRTVGRRDDDASYGRAIRQLLSGREQQFAEFVGSNGNTQKAPTEKRSGSQREIEDFPKDAANWRYQITTDDNGKYLPAAGAPPTVVQDYRDYVAARERRLDLMARNYGNLENIPAQVQQQLQAVQQHAALTQEQQTISELQGRYAKGLFVDGAVDEKGRALLTANGKKVEAEFDRLREIPHFSQVPNSVLFQESLRRVFGENQNRTGAKPGSRAVRTTAGAATADSKTYKSVEEEIASRIAEDPNKMVEILTEIHGRKGGKLG